MSPRRFAVRVVTAVSAKRGPAVFVPSPDIELDSKRQCLREADRLQAAFDKDCDPKRAYVVAPDGVPVDAGGIPTHHPRSTL